MTDLKRTELRLKQDFLLMLAVDMKGYDGSIHIDEKASSPTLRSLRYYLFPEWEGFIDNQIRSLAAAQRPAIRVPDFTFIAQEWGK